MPTVGAGTIAVQRTSSRRPTRARRSWRRQGFAPKPARAETRTTEPQTAMHLRPPLPNSSTSSFPPLASTALRSCDATKHVTPVLSCAQRNICGFAIPLTPSGECGVQFAPPVPDKLRSCHRISIPTSPPRATRKHGRPCCKGAFRLTRQRERLYIANVRLCDRPNRSRKESIPKNNEKWGKR
jgi:hypothetical protein